MQPPKRARRAPNNDIVTLDNGVRSSNRQSRNEAPAACIALVLALLATGCWSQNLAQADPEGLAALDETTFRCAVQPILQRECSYLGCHGREEMPLRVYGVGALRLEEGRTSAGRARPLTSAEEHANFLSAQGQSFHTPPERNQLVLKGLPSRAGGYAHVGGVIWSGLDDPRVHIILGWLCGQAGGCAAQDGGP